MITALHRGDQGIIRNRREERKEVNTSGSETPDRHTIPFCRYSMSGTLYRIEGINFRGAKPPLSPSEGEAHPSEGEAPYPPLREKPLSGRISLEHMLFTHR